MSDHQATADAYAEIERLKTIAAHHKARAEKAEAEVARLCEVNGELWEALAVKSDEEADPDWEEPIFNAPWMTGGAQC